MLEFMDYLQCAFYEASRWNYGNSYANLTATARALLDFDTPRGFRLNVSSLSSPNSAASYSLASIGVVDGSISYLYSSLPIGAVTKSGSVDLHEVIRGYRQLQENPTRGNSCLLGLPQGGGNGIDRRNALLYGRLYLPQSTLEALYLKRISLTQQFKLAAVSDSRLRNGGTLLATHQYDVGRFSTEALYSTDGGLLGLKGLYNFGSDPTREKTESSQTRNDHGRFSAGAEVYYGMLNKSGGMSIGGRFATLPSHTGTPLTATLTLNPIIGSFSTTYAIKAGENLTLCSKFGFNAYSYESDLILGCELWKMERKPPKPRERSMAAKLNWTLDSDEVAEEPENVAGVLKAKVDHNYKIGVLWEGRIRELLFSLGASFDMNRRDQPFRSLGLELQYST